MHPESYYQGLFYLTAGAGLFATMLFTLRNIGLNRSTRSRSASSSDEGWHRKEPLRIIDIINETSSVKTFRFVRVNGKPFPKSLAGQFLSFQIGEDTKCLRSYSISASPHNRATLQVSIKKLNNGKGSGWFHERKVGEQVYAFPPNGLFTDDDYGPEVTRNYCAGGIGITPLISMILANLDTAKNCKMNLFYGMRNTQELAFHKLLCYLSERFPNLSYYPVLSEKDGNWQGPNGYVTTDLVLSKNPNPRDSVYFFCAPSVMTDKLIEGLLAAGVSAERLHSEKFASPTAFDPEKIPNRSARVTFRGKEYSYNGKQTLLEFLESNGESIPFACRVGVCGTCKTGATGKVTAITDSGLSLIDRKKGMVLTCVAFPEENVVLS